MVRVLSELREGLPGAQWIWSSQFTRCTASRSTSSNATNSASCSAAPACTSAAAAALLLGTCSGSAGLSCLQHKRLTHFQGVPKLQAECQDTAGVMSRAGRHMNS